jgi:hypothetical protein
MSDNNTSVVGGATTLNVELIRWEWNNRYMNWLVLKKRYRFLLDKNN